MLLQKMINLGFSFQVSVSPMIYGYSWM